MKLTQWKSIKAAIAASVLGAFVSLAIPSASSAQETAPQLDEAAEKVLEAVEKDFDESLKDLGELAGEVFSCNSDESSRDKHESRVRDIYGELNKLFGTDRAFLFATAFGYGAASEQDKMTCTELTDEFEDRYGAITEKYNLID